MSGEPGCQRNRLLPSKTVSEWGQCHHILLEYGTRAPDHGSPNQSFWHIDLGRGLKNDSYPGGLPMAQAKPVSLTPLSFEKASSGLSRADPPVSFLRPKKATSKPKQRQNIVKGV